MPRGAALTTATASQFTNHEVRWEVAAMTQVEPLTATGWRGRHGRTWALLLRWPPATGKPSGPQQRQVRVNGAYHPSEIHVKAGLPIRLIFRREETAPRSEQLVFPELGISVMLPPFQPVAIGLPASEPGEHRFCCQMNVLHGRPIIDPVAPTNSEGQADGMIAANGYPLARAMSTASAGHAGQAKGSRR